VLDETVALLDYNKLRIDLRAEADDNLDFAADVIFQTYHGRRKLNAFDFIPERIVSKYAAELGVSVADLEPDFAIPFEDEIFIDNAYVTYYSRRFNGRVGKQQLPWGSGYAWNPTDIFHDKNLLDPTYEKRGVNALRLEVPLGTMGRATAVLAPDATWKQSTRAVRVSQHIKGFDVAAVAGWLRDESIDYLTFEEREIDRSLFGGDLSGEIGGVGVWIEAAYNRAKHRDNYEEILLGFDYTFEGGLYLMAEIFRNGDGATDKDEYTINSWMRLLSSDGENLGREYVLAGNTYPLTDLLTWSNFALANLNDGSAIVYPYLVYSLSDNTEVTLIGYLPVGQYDSEFGAFGAGAILRARVYF
jgi:hypothetical protein